MSSLDEALLLVLVTCDALLVVLDTVLVELFKTGESTGVQSSRLGCELKLTRRVVKEPLRGETTHLVALKDRRNFIFWIALLSLLRREISVIIVAASIGDVIMVCL